jgi:menaquinone-dependent protoporphyrinogen oxidase
MKALVVYGTRGGATKAIAEEIGKALAGQGYEAAVKDVRDTKGVDVKAFDLIIAGSSVWAGAWTGKAAGFLKSNQEALANTKIALFSSGLTGNDPEKADEARKSIAKLAASYPALKPIALAFFGGYMDFNSPNLITRMVAGAMKKEFQKKGIDTSKPYDTRDFAAIRKWAEEVAAKAR